MRPFELHEPEAISEACRLLGVYGDEALPLAGGTALLILMKSGVVRPAHLVNLAGLPGLAEIEYEAGRGLRIGALVTHSNLERSAVVRTLYPAIAETYQVVGNVRVRNAATVGGNLAEADYRLDPPAPLMVFDARVRIAGPAGEREVPLSSFYKGLFQPDLGLGEIITQVVVPEPPQGSAAVYLKYSSASAMDWPCVGVAALLAMQDGRCRELRVALTAVASTPIRIQGLEDAAIGRSLTDEVLSDVAELVASRIEPTADARGSEWYKREVSKVLVRRAIEAAHDRLRRKG